MDQNNAIQKGLNAAKQAAREEGMQNQVEELASQMGINTTGSDDDGDGTPLAAKDGVRFDLDDSSDL
ncbi:hypothetical protein [Tumebacillus flagellatus]|uniref:Uncharacterized protein n=1 Tax=Tumebacillus flagellatus TaxID=1157490 RepID=A0A074LJI9_9BACL|nr:hypothetical protein [Tumebacillus flagellatus]KEO81264.1 hypothetical protein EL26_21540 [Tumebacillus flagellatus]